MKIVRLYSFMAALICGVAGSMYAAPAAPVSDKLINQLNDNNLRAYLKGLSDKGYAAKPQNDATKRLLEQRIQKMAIPEAEKDKVSATVEGYVSPRKVEPIHQEPKIVEVIQQPSGAGVSGTGKGNADEAELKALKAQQEATQKQLVDESLKRKGLEVELAKEKESHRETVAESKKEAQRRAEEEKAADLKRKQEEDAAKLKAAQKAADVKRAADEEQQQRKIEQDRQNAKRDAEEKEKEIKGKGAGSTAQAGSELSPVQGEGAVPLVPRAEGEPEQGVQPPKPQQDQKEGDAKRHNAGAVEIAPQAGSDNPLAGGPSQESSAEQAKKAAAEKEEKDKKDGSAVAVEAGSQAEGVQPAPDLAGQAAGANPRHPGTSTGQQAGSGKKDISGKEVKEQEAVKPEDLTQALAAENKEVSGLSDAEKLASDQALVEVLKVLSNEVKPFAEYKKLIISSLQALAKNKVYRKPIALKQLLGTPAHQGTLLVFITTKLTMPADKQSEFLEMVYADVTGQETLVKEFLAVIKPGLCNEFYIKSDGASDIIETLIINTAVAQRVVRNWSDLDMSVSDEQAENMLTAILKSAEAEKINNTLQKDYIPVIAKAISRIRVNPEFLKFSDLIGSDARANAKEKKSKLPGGPQLIDAERFSPILDKLQGTSASFFTPKVFLDLFAQQLLFIADFGDLKALKQELQKDGILKQVLDYHLAILKKQAGAVDVYELLNKKLKTATTIPAIKAAFDTLIKEGVDNSLIAPVTKILNAAPINSDELIQALKTLTGRDALEFEPNLRKVITAYTKSQEGAIAVLKMLTGIKALFNDNMAQAKKKVLADPSMGAGSTRDTLVANLKNNPEYKVGDALIKGIEHLPRPPLRELSAEKKELLQGLYATVDTIHSVIAGLVPGNQEIKAAWPLESSRAMVHDYGVLMSVLENSTHKDIVDPANLSAYISKFSSLLTALNTGTIKEDDKDIPAIKNNSTLIQSGIYKDRLTGIIADLQRYNLVGFFDLVEKFVAQARLGVEQTAAYRALVHQVRNLLITTMHALVVQDIKARNNGEQDLSGVPFRSNTAFYKALKGKFAPIVKALTENIATLDMDAVAKDFEDILNNVEVTKTLNDTRDKALQAFSQDMLARLKNLKEAAQQAAQDTAQEKEHKEKEAAVAEAGGGIPDAPDFGGGIPDAPDFGDGGIPAAPPL